MPGLDPGIYAFLSICQDVDGRDKPGHDDAPLRHAAFAIAATRSQVVAFMLGRASMC